ncbi:TIGR02186 family protein [Qipengyuania psychrotolerans]|uniref:TIGR02186 family protein n=1 Tax=Qipengyuania psychrotolerans TaxID=2867238 RepID=A0ABX8ZG36_9SPHN|nr:TIGR02186 family protein [Qipengyuania psychrotolerans]QZD86482.1 TIGR02186 family protein [Qipengyuania psychrotolerans]
MRVALLLIAALFLMGQRDPVLVPEVSQHEVQVRQGFVGQELLLFGAVLDPTGAAGRDYDIVVVLKGPSEPIRLREKERFIGVWVNAESSDFRSVPSYFAVASSRPITEIVDQKTAAIYEFGTEYIQLSPSGSINPEEERRFAAGLVDLKRRLGLYRENFGGVEIKESVLYQARIELPSNVTTGTYTAETFAVSRGRVIASAVAEVAVRKVGFERFVEDSANDWGLAYGLIAVMLSVGMGWGAGRLFARL